jgi:uroporphyrinogen decarboxylase
MAKKSPDIKEFIKTLRREPAEFIPNAELGIHPVIIQKFLGHRITSVADEVEFWWKAGYDYIKFQPTVNFDPAGIAAQRNLMPSGDGTVVRKWASEQNGVITCRADLDKYVLPRRDEITYERIKKGKAILPPGMGIIGQYGDIFTMTWEMMGFEAFSMAVYEEPDLVSDLNLRLGEIVVSMFEKMAADPAVDVLWYSDDIAYATGLMVSPTILRHYFFPWLEQIGNIAKSAGKPLIYHTDGILYDVMEDIIACGVDALHPIEPKAMAIADVKRRYGDRLCLIGHVDVDMLTRGTQEEVRAQVRKNISDAWNGTGYCVGSGNSIPEYVEYENYMAMLDEARRANNNGQ